MDVLSQLDNDNGSHRENRLSVASKTTTSKSTGKQNVRLSVNQKEKIVSASVLITNIALRAIIRLGRLGQQGYCLRTFKRT